MIRRRHFARVNVLFGGLTFLTPAFLAITCLISSCADVPASTDADVIIIGGGIAGLSAALEASSNGASVLIIETSSVPGGHAVKAGGFALVGTPLQERKGFDDSPDIAYDDLMAWGEDADPVWVRLFADNSRTEIHDWLTGFGVKFSILLDTPEDTIPRFHFAGGAAVNVIVPMLREAMKRDNLKFTLNTEAENLSTTGSGIFSIRTRNTRTGTRQDYVAPAIIIATGGFQSNLGLVRDNFRTPVSDHSAAPERLLIGSGQYATGDGLGLGQSAGAQLIRMNRQVTFVNGLPDPRDPQRGLHVENPAAIRVDANGRRFVDESAHAKILESAVMNLDRRMHWLVFDDHGRKKLRIRGAVWLNRETIANEIMNNPDVMHKNNSIAALAKIAGLPADQLQATIDRYNADVAAGHDTEFGSFGPMTKKLPANVRAISNPPFYAVQLLPMTRKSMGGLAIDMNTQVIDQDDRPIEGLFAAGEATGVAGINGSHGGSGTFLAPSVLTGRIAGRNAAASTQRTNAFVSMREGRPEESAADSASMMTAVQLRSLLERKRAGFWHWERSHTIVLERKLACTDCHSPQWPTAPAMTGDQQVLMLDSCTLCH